MPWIAEFVLQPFGLPCASHAVENHGNHSDASRIAAPMKPTSSEPLIRDSFIACASSFDGVRVGLRLYPRGRAGCGRRANLGSVCGDPGAGGARSLPGSSNVVASTRTQTLPPGGADSLDEIGRAS